MRPNTVRGNNDAESGDIMIDRRRVNCRGEFRPYGINGIEVDKILNEVQILNKVQNRVVESRTMRNGRNDRRGGRLPSAYERITRK